MLHAANAALLFVLLRRLVKAEMGSLAENLNRRVQLAAAAVTLVFALHPLAVEPVSAINYSSDLLVTFFTLLALLTATAFKAENSRSAWRLGGAGALCCFAAVTCKESGIAVALLLIVYWFLFRRNEAKKPWLWFLGAATTATVAFLAARFALAPTASEPVPAYLGGSFFSVFLIQPRLWVFMMGKLLWPAQLSADYTLENVSGISVSVALTILFIVIALQAWLAITSRIGAFGIGICWLGLVTVSNFIPLSRMLGDRFYYLPLVGVSMQLLALFLMILKTRWEFWAALVPCLGALPLLTFLTLMREDVFANEVSFWNDTVQVSPRSSRAHAGLGGVLLQSGQTDAAITQFQEGLEIDPQYSLARMNLGVALVRSGRVDEGITQLQKAVDTDPNAATALNDLGYALLQKGQTDQAAVDLQKALAITPNFAAAHFNLGNAFALKGKIDEAIDQYQKALEIDPNNIDAKNNLAKVETWARQAPGSK